MNARIAAYVPIFYHFCGLKTQNEQNLILQPFTCVCLLYFLQ